MIIDELVLQNFGVYRGRQVMNLAPVSSEQPVILFGGLNGGGKTTLLDAIQLVLYGKHARCSGRGSLSYDDYLKECIHRHGDQKGAGLEIQLRRYIDGEPHIYRVRRSWSLQKGTIKEVVEVLYDGVYDPVLTEMWAEHMEEHFPARIAQLFFFDGEKIAEFADLKNSAEVLGTAVHSLLGVDLIEQLQTDLKVLERRKRAATKSTAEREEIERLETLVKSLEQACADLTQERARIQTHGVDKQQKLLDQLNARYANEGGTLLDNRKVLEEEQQEAKQNLASTERQLRELAAGVAPFLLLQPLLDASLQQAIAERDASRTGLLVGLLNERDADLLQYVRGLDANLGEAIGQYLAADRNTRSSAYASSAPYLQMDAEALKTLEAVHHVALPEVKNQATKLQASAKALHVRLNEIERKLASMPHPDAIAALIKERDDAERAWKEAVRQLEQKGEQLAGAQRELAKAETQLNTLYMQNVEGQLEQEENSRIVKYSDRVQRTLEGFRHAVVSRHIHRIEGLVLNSFQQLLRKASLVKGLTIDPETFTLTVLDRDGNPLHPDRLSAGERQLLAASMIWGLARASGRALPAVIDTPLGRLDSKHRINLVTNYFPFASHQVLLLSTDEEITPVYYEKLKPYIGRSYQLIHDDEQGCTRVEPGYFWEGQTA